MDEGDGIATRGTKRRYDLRMPASKFSPLVIERRQPFGRMYIAKIVLYSLRWPFHVFTEPVRRANLRIIR